MNGDSRSRFGQLGAVVLLSFLVLIAAVVTLFIPSGWLVTGIVLLAIAGSIGLLRRTPGVDRRVVHVGRRYRAHGDDASRRELASALHDRAVARHSQGLFDEARADYTHALELLARLEPASRSPDDAWRSAGAHVGLAYCLFHLSRPQDALVEYDNATQAYRDLEGLDPSTEQPGSVSENLAGCAAGRADCLTALCKFTEAMEQYDDAVDRYRHLSENEDHRDLEASLAATLIHRGHASERCERSEEARADYEAAIDIYTRLIESRGREFAQKGLAVSYTGLGCVLARGGELGEAIESHDAAIELCERSLHQDRASELEETLAMNYLGRGTCLRRLGKPQESLPSLERAAEIYRELIDRGRRDLERELAVVRRELEQANHLT